MAERYPEDAALLALTQDAQTGVEYIPTGKSPYHLEFRKLLQRTLLACERANDLRVYQEGDLTIGVRPGRCLIQDNAIDFAGQEGVAVDDSSTTHVWLDDAGQLQTGESGLPADRTTFLPLAQVVADATAITSINDLRGEGFLLVPTLALLGLTATADEVNQALDGINATVDAWALNVLTGGPTSTADSEHRHLSVWQDADSEVLFSLYNNNAGSNANVGLHMGLPSVLNDGVILSQDRGHGFLKQRYEGTTYFLVGTVHAQFVHEGDLLASLAGKLIGVVPIDGTVSAVVMSVGTNIESDTSTDGVSATVKVNGTAVASTDPSISDADAAGFRSTAQGDGVAAVIKTDGTQDVLRGDVLTVDITRSVAGAVTVEPADAVVLVVIRVNRPE